jgi:hypothetical protein
MQLNLVVDLIFASVQTAMLPYFANYISVGISVAGTMLFISWRAYAGVDRLQTFLPNAKRVLTSSSGPASAVRGIGRLAAQGAISPVKDNIPMSMRMHGNGAQGSYAEWEEETGKQPEDIEAQTIERSETAETESLDDSESTASEASSAEPKIDRRQVYKDQKDHHFRNSGLREVTEDQRHLYHIVDSVSSAVLITVVRLAAIITSALIRNLPVSAHLNKSFQISDDQWRDATVYALIFIVGVVLVLLGVGMYLRNGADLGGLTLNRIISFMFRDSFWFFFFWFCITQYLSIALQLNHFGADFSLDFEWLSCRESMAWPGCVQMTPV